MIKTHYKAFILIVVVFSFGFAEGLLSDYYHTYEEIQSQLEEWDTEFGSNTSPSPAYPGSGIIYHTETIGYSTLDQLPIYAVCLSYNADLENDKPKILFLGQCHAEEIFGVEITMELICRFLNPTPQYPIQNMQAILQSCEVWVIPTYNPEGLRVVHGYQSDTTFIQDVSFRKNKRDVNGNNMFDFIVGVGNDSDGVDLNRNFDLNWFLGDGPYQEDHSGGDYQSHYDYYRGAAPFSESETQAIRDFALEKQFFLSIAYHSSRSGNVAEKVIYPWYWASGKSSADYGTIAALGGGIAGLIPKEADVGSYTPIPSVSRRGNTHDWLYAETGCIQYLIEVGTQNMQPDDSTLVDDTIERNLRGAFHLMNRSFGYGQGEFAAESYQVTGIVSDSETGLPIPGSIVDISELTSPVIKPRKTDQYGRYRRLLSPGTVTLNISAKGYYPYTELITPSSVVPLEVDCSLDLLPEYTVTFSVTSPSSSEGPFDLFIEDQFSIDTHTITDGDNDFILPINEYKVQVNSPSTLPQIFSFELTNDTTITLDLSQREIFYQESFEDSHEWTVVSGDWVIENDGTFLSQTALLYPQGVSTIISEPISVPTGHPLVLNIDWQYEVEWEYDSIMVEIIGNIDTTNFLWNYPKWERHEENVVIETESDTIQIGLHLITDTSLRYRGIRLYSVSLLSDTTTSNSIDRNEIPSAFSVSPVYPNPFNPMTNIQYHLPYESHVDISIYNLLGQHITTLVSKKQNAGEKHLIWNAGSASSGIYFLQVTTDHHSTTQKLILLK